MASSAALAYVVVSCGWPSMLYAVWASLWPYSWVCRKAYYQHKYRVATPTFEVRVISVFSGLSCGSMLDVNLLMVDPTNKPVTTNITEKSQYGGHCEFLHSTTF